MTKADLGSDKKQSKNKSAPNFFGIVVRIQDFSLRFRRLCKFSFLIEKHLFRFYLDFRSP